MAVQRYGARVLLLDADDRILLFRLINPRTGNTWWSTPGGGVEKGEQSIAAARRELKEETGLDAEELEGPVWADDHWFRTAEDLIHQSDRYFLLRVDHPVIDTTGLDQVETQTMVEHRWWSVDEIAASDAKIYPRGLAGHLRDLLRDGVPTRPIAIKPPPKPRA